jgi:hypothetical protein
MRRFAVLVSALAALMFVWTGAALAQTTTDEGPPGCNGTIHLSGSSVQDGGNGTTPKFARRDTVTVNGTGFDANQAFTGYTVDDVNDGQNVITSNTAWNADANGAFSFSFSTSEAGFEDAHEYKVTVYFTKEVGNEECHKSKNFFLTVEEGGGGAGGNPPPPPPPPSGSGGAGAGGGGSLGEEAGSGAQGALPFTGLPVAFLGIAGLVLLLGGLGLMRSASADN